MGTPAAMSHGTHLLSGFLILVGDEPRVVAGRFDRAEDLSHRRHARFGGGGGSFLARLRSRTI